MPKQLIIPFIHICRIIITLVYRLLVIHSYILYWTLFVIILTNEEKEARSVSCRLFAICDGLLPNCILPLTTVTHQLLSYRQSLICCNTEKKEERTGKQIIKYVPSARREDPEHSGAPLGPHRRTPHGTAWFWGWWRHRWVPGYPDYKLSSI